ncbi:hypothetical protein ACOT5C_13255 [Clostridium perfringens]|uniref:hypothetical protein n=1 Tax=Clostridium perfringens TaxID=1502 RepID=UPI00103EE36B|nr:hypothetical protein [Clostridium perfringens]TBX05950.1 hypothetical protein BFS03_12750 [Clostridium perfringens]
MVKIIILCSLIFLSIGMYSRLQKFGAPFSSILYAGAIPFSAILFNIILGIKYVKENKDLKGIKKLVAWIIFQIQGIKMLNLVVTLFIVKIGSMKLGFLDLFKLNKDMHLKIFIKIKAYVEQQVKMVFNSSYEDILLKQV